MTASVDRETVLSMSVTVMLMTVLDNQIWILTGTGNNALEFAGPERAHGRGRIQRG
jgi:hypothetical protein